jgi:hypothetical protein
MTEIRPKPQLLISGILLAGLLLPVTQAMALRCGSKLIDEGDLKYAVLRACGEPLAREIIGSSERPGRGSREYVLLLEEWIIEIGRNYYRLVFEGNRLIKIEDAGRRD